MTIYLFARSSRKEKAAIFLYVRANHAYNYEQ